MISVEPEIIKCGIANSIGVLVLPKRFASPGDGAAALIHCPRHTAITLIVKGAVVSPAGFLLWRVEADISYVHSWSHGHSEGLNSAIQVLVIQGVFIVPDTGRRVSDPIPEKPDTVISRIGLEPVADRCACPGHDGGLRSHR